MAKKSVSFSDVITVFEFEDSEISRSSREKYWEYFAVDRLHSRNRVFQIEETISKVLDSLHREHIFSARFK